MLQLPEPLLPLAAYNQFIIWTLWFSSKTNRWEKVPIDYRNMKIADAHNPQIQLDFTTASQMCAALGKEYRVGFVFTENDPFFFMDVDKCWDGSSWSQIALELSATFSGAAVEVSQSGTGLHIIGSGICPPHGCKNAEYGLELYTEKRFCALTGINAIGSAAANCSAILPTVVQKYFTPSAAAVGPDPSWTTEPVEGYSSTESDEQLIAKALAATSAKALLGDGARFYDLWTRNVDVLSQAYPDKYNHPPKEFDESSADLALAQHLMFWTGGNCERTEELMRQSSLIRDKWDRSGDNYMERTILRAARNQKSYYSVRTAPPNPYQQTSAPPPATISNNQAPSTVGYQYLNTDVQKEYFAGCVYVQDVHKIFTPGGDLLDMGRFNAMYGGYVFQLDEIGDKTTRKAWEAFTENQAVRFPKVQGLCFKPLRMSGEIFSDEGRSVVNTYVPADILSIPGDVSPFTGLLKKLFPNENDRKIILSYMAACIQHIGVKFKWTPFIQGVQGNGKSFLNDCVTYAVGRRYSHYPKAKELDGKFNAWLAGKLFYAVNDIYVPSNKLDMLEALKPMITDEVLEIEGKNENQYSGEICGNFILNANKKEAVPKTNDDRRYAIFFCPQQAVEDLIKDGMGGEYFPKLYNWAKHENGFAFIANYLKNYKIEEKYNPATLCHRAPETSSTGAAIVAGLGRIEQDILEAVEEERAGFCKGWISSVALERLLQETRQSRLIPINKRREMLQSLGYDYHPELTNGRSNVPIGGDEGKKPRIFIKQGHLYRNITGAGNVVRQYQVDQGFIVEAVPIPGSRSASS